MKIQLHHVALTVDDLSDSIKWYQDIFGCEVVRKYDKADTHIALLSLGDCYLELFHFDDTQTLPDYRRDVMRDLGVVGTKHMGLQVDNLENAITQLKQKGVEVLTDPDTTFFGGRYAFCRDCNGILIELYERGKAI